MKDEFKGKIISEFVGLKSKIYSLVTEDNKEIKKKKQKESIKTLLKAQHIKFLIMFSLIKI